MHSASEWVDRSNPSQAEAEREVQYLQETGFVGAVAARFRKKDAEAIAEALIYGTASQAQASQAVDVEELQKDIEHKDIVYHLEGTFRKYDVPTIPGSIGLGGFNPAKHIGAGNVLFPVGRCFFTVGDSVGGVASFVTGARPASVAAEALYKQVRGLC